MVYAVPDSNLARSVSPSQNESMFNRKYWAALLVGFIVFSVAIVTFFFAWAMADGPSPSRHAALVFKVVSFPIFAIVPEPSLSLYFWPLGIGNCGLIAVVMAALTLAGANRARPSE